MNTITLTYTEDGKTRTKSVSLVEWSLYQAYNGLMQGVWLSMLKEEAVIDDAEISAAQAAYRQFHHDHGHKQSRELSKILQDKFGWSKYDFDHSWTVVFGV